MPIQHAIWQVGQIPNQLISGKLASEQLLEDMIVRDSRILSPEWMLIGGQAITNYGGRIDLLAFAPDGSLVLAELKRDRTPREIVPQALDYASLVVDLSADRISQIYSRLYPGQNIAADFKQRFGTALNDESLNHSHQIIIVAAELGPATERIVKYLNDRDIAISVLFFRVFDHGGEQLLSRAWLIDPSETQANAASKTSTNGEKEPWNGEFYVPFGDRSWEDAVQYCCISEGGGAWYTRTVKLLSPRDRVWVNMPGRGYVGVGEVLEAVQPASSFKINTPDGERLALDVLKSGEVYMATATDPEMSEDFVRVKWLQTVPMAPEFFEVGLFRNQNTVCQPTTPK